MDDPNQPEFWNSRYEKGETPWDFGGAPAALKAFLKAKPKGGRVLIPGCGAGHEIGLFAAAGYDVTAIDFAPAAVARARQAAGPALADRVLQGDFFQHEFAPASFDLIYERTFLCALVPGRRTAYRDRVAQLLKHGAALVGFFYYQNTVTGPPFGFAWSESDELFGRHFLLTKDIPVKDSVGVFAGRERWQEQRRTAFGAS
ncbi:MAG: tpm [Verrucomicrobia bacterium]|nr:tpm [Verrucomicrobiota bacterium]